MSTSNFRPDIEVLLLPGHTHPKTQHTTHLLPTTQPEEADMRALVRWPHQRCHVFAHRC